VIVTVLFFAQAREHAGRARGTLELPEGSRVADALARLEREHPALAPLWPHLAVAVDRRLVRGDAVLADGVELALLPPVSGG
jgi:molybdopterin converting factor subunit 1